MKQSNATFPQHAYIQRFDSVPPDYELVAAELTSRGVPISFRISEDIQPYKSWPLTRNDLVVGDFDWTHLALKRLGIPMPQAPDYPQCLQHLLHRRVWQSTLGEVQTLLKSGTITGQIFIKPADTAKAFSAIIEPKDQMLDTLLAGMEDVMAPLPRSLRVHCSEVVEMVSEFRVYVVNGAIRSVCEYRGCTEDDAIALDMGVVNEAIMTLNADAECQDVVAGCGIDFAVIKKQREEGYAYCTGLVEVNDGFSLGRYPGLSGKDYTDLLIARWAKLVQDNK